LDNRYLKHYISKIPGLLSMSVTFIIGVIGYFREIEMMKLYMRMLLSLLIFFLIGMIIKKIMLSMVDKQYEMKISEIKANHNQESQSTEK